MPDNSSSLTPSFSLLPKSYRLALKTYEQIAILFFIPSLLGTLGDIYASSLKYTQFVHFQLTNAQLIGLILLIVWVVLSLINFSPSVYFRVESSKDREPPTLKECYSIGFKKAAKILLSEIAAILIIAIGTIAFIIPGVLAFRRYIFSAYYAADNPQLSIRDILDKSAQETKPYSASVYATFGVVILYSFMLEYILGGFAIGSIIIIILNYLILFLPVLRYQEIVSINPTTSFTSKINKRLSNPKKP